MESREEKTDEIEMRMDIGWIWKTKDIKKIANSTVWYVQNGYLLPSHHSVCAGVKDLAGAMLVLTYQLAS